MMSIEEFKPLAQGKIPKNSNSLSIESYMMQYKSVSDWLTTIRHGKATRATKANYSRCLYYYCKEVRKNPDELLREREQEFLSQEKAVRFHAEDTFRTTLAQYKGKTSVATLMACAAKSFFKFHRMGLNEGGFAYSANTNTDYIPNSEEVLRLYLQVGNLSQSTKLRDEAIVLFAAETGLRPQQIVKFRYKHIKNEYEAAKIPMLITVPSEISKAHVSSTSFILRDGYEALKRYLESREEKGEKITDDSFLFLSLAKEGASLEAGYIGTLFHKLGALAGLPVEKSAQKRFRAYSLRKRMETILESAQPTIFANWIDLLLNHKPSKTADASSYSRPSDEQLRSAYLRVARELTVIPEYLKNLPESPNMSLTTEAMKMALRLLPLGAEKTLQVTKEIRDIENSNLSLAEKYDQLYKLTGSTVRAFRNGGDEYTQDILPLEEAKALVKDGEAQILQVLPDGSILVKRRKRSKADEEQALAILRANEDSRGTFSTNEVLQANFNA